MEKGGERMDCEQLRAKLDAYMDGELSPAELAALEAHAVSCENCARELAAARLTREALKSLGDEVSVPLPLQASWRRAVREEAAKRERRAKGRRWLRIAYGAAAALLLVFGATALLRNLPKDEPMTIAIEQELDAGEQPPVAQARGAAIEPQAVLALPTEAVVASDGEAEDAPALPQGETYAARKKFSTPDADAHALACETVEALTEEYSGSFEVEPATEDSATAIYRVELPSVYLDEFLSAVAHVGVELDSETREPAGEAALIYIQID